MRSKFYLLRVSPTPGRLLTDTHHCHVSISWLLSLTGLPCSVNLCEKGRNSWEVSGLSYQALEAWAWGSGFSAWCSHTGNTKYLCLLCFRASSQAWGGWVVSKPSLSFCPSSLLHSDSSEALPILQALLRFCGLAANLTGVSIWAVRGETQVDAVCLETPGLDLGGWVDLRPLVYSRL